MALVLSFVVTSHRRLHLNFSHLLVLPAAILTAVIFAVIAQSGGGVMEGPYPYNFIKILPYLGVLITALMGVNVLLVLVGGIIFAGIVGMAYGSFDFFGFLQAAFTGMTWMEDLAMIAIVIGGLVELIKVNGGIDWLLSYIQSKIKNKKGAEFGIAALVSVADICTANNTIAIVMTGPLAKDISNEFDIDPKRSASILDIFSSAWQGIVPYGGQLLAAAGLAQISPFEIVPYMYYLMLMIVFGVLGIMFCVPKLKSTGKAKQSN